MAQSAARKIVGLRVVETPPAYEKEVELFDPSDVGSSHSLHYAVPFPGKMQAELAHALIDRFSARGAMVLDPFCGSGVVGLESALMGRIPVLSDVNLLALRMAQAALYPADITEVTLRLQLMAFNKPVDSRLHNEYFEPFYDIRTFCELYNLRTAIQSSYDRVTQFIELLTFGLLHGHSSGHCSVYTFPQVSVQPSQQLQLNQKRRQTPDYRAVMPRLLRRCASVIRDGVPSVMSKSAQQGGVNKADASNLYFLDTSMVDSIITSPPVPGEQDFSSDMWLRLWFAGLHKSGMYDESALLEASTDEWLDFMNAALFEFARVLKGGGRAVFEFADSKERYDELLSAMVTEHLHRFWDVEGTLVNASSGEVLSNSLKARQDSKRAKLNRILILRRK